MRTSPAAEGAALGLKQLRLAYGAHTVLDIDAFALAAGATLGVTGASGSGKTSLLHLLAAIERPSAGQVAWNGTDIAALGEAARDRWRRETLGLVFQDFHLVPGLDARDNLLLPAWFDHVSAPEALKQRATTLLQQIGLGAATAPVERLSRGEQQRVAVARALLRRPRVVLADEPTASLDAVAAKQIGDLLLGLTCEVGATLIVVTHDAALLERMDERRRLVAGRLEPL